ncbi:MAG TPA: hypothetical protein VJO99_18565 [Burkholderiaceae bacterium]|nr:hypothetical protein [Burkholderiaceae bacterium]
MNEMETALDDLDGLHEALHALSDTRRTSPLARNAELGKTLRRELAAAADAYVSTVISTSRGELDPKRVRKCRTAAAGMMPTAVANQKRLASLVEQRRIPAPQFREDLQQLLSLSLHCRAALAALAPTVDRRAAEALGNKVLVELRGATLLYVSTARTVDDGAVEKARAAVVEQLNKAESHAAECVALAPEPGDDVSSLGVTLSKDVVETIHGMSHGWSTAAAPSASEGVGDLAPVPYDHVATAHDSIRPSSSSRTS